MNPWMRDPRVERAEAEVFDAERAERNGDLTRARELYRSAAEGFAVVALRVSPDHPNTRGDLAIAAVASYARACDFGGAIDLGRRVLAEHDALTTEGRAELQRLVQEYQSLVAPPSRPPSGERGRAVREQVRGMFRRAA